MWRQSEGESSYSDTFYTDEDEFCWFYVSNYFEHDQMIYLCCFLTIHRFINEDIYLSADMIPVISTAEGQIHMKGSIARKEKG